MLESDVPIPQGLDALSTADVGRSAGVLTSVRVVCRGDLRSISESSDRVRDAFSMQGWSCTAVNARTETATLTFSKDDRVATVDVHVNRVDPKMGSAVIRVRPAQPAPAAPAAAK